MELRGKPSVLFAVVEHLEGYKVNEFLGMSSGCGVGGIQLTEILLSW